MNFKNRLAGRFLPSRVFARWKWIVRFGLSALPLTLFTAGGVTYYFTPSRYESTAVFEYLGKRPLAEVEALLKSRNVMGPAISKLNLTERLDLDSETLGRVISKGIRTTVDSATGMIELNAEDDLKEIACNLAAELPKSLDAYERSLASSEITVRLEAAEKSVTDGEDEAGVKRQALARLVSVRGDQAVDPVSQLDLDAARGDWDHAYQRVHEGREKVAEARRELAALGKWVVIHSQPTISQEPVGKKAGETMGVIILQSLAVGVAFALSAPYLMELAFPRRRLISARGSGWSEAADPPDFSGEPANG